MPENNELNVGSAEGNESVDTDLGETGGDVSSLSSPDVSEANSSSELEELKYQNKALNQRLADFRRQANSNKGRYNPENQANDSSGNGNTRDYFTEQAVAESDMRATLESRLALYPELPSKIISMIRTNPWGFVSDKNALRTLNIDIAIDDIEQWVADYVAESAGVGSESTSAPKGKVSKTLKPNTAPESLGETGEDEELSDYELPMEELEKKVKKIQKGLV